MRRLSEPRRQQAVSNFYAVGGAGGNVGVRDKAAGCVQGGVGPAAGSGARRRPARPPQARPRFAELIMQVLSELIVSVRADHKELADHLLFGNGREKRLERGRDLVEVGRMDVQMDDARATARWIPVRVREIAVAGENDPVLLHRHANHRTVLGSRGRPDGIVPQLLE